MGDPTTSVVFADTTIIYNQRKGQTQFLGKIAMCLKIIFTHAQDLGVELLKTLDVVLKSLHFAGSARGEIGVIVSQNNRAVFQQVAENNLSVSRFG